MRRNRVPRPTFAQGDFVFAKMLGYRPWPARVLGRYGVQSKIKYSVFFYGTCNTAKVSISHICDYDTNERRLGALPSKSTARNADFRSAMAHMRLAFERPETDFAYYQVLARTSNDGGSSVAYEMLSTTDSDPETELESDSNGKNSGDSTETPENPKSEVKEQDSDGEVKEQHSDEEDSDPESELESYSNEKDSRDSTETLENLKTEIKEQDSDEEVKEQDSEEADDTVKMESDSEEEEAPQPAKKLKKSMPLLDDYNDDPDDQDQTYNALEKKLEKLDGDTALFSDADSDSFEFEGNPMVRDAHLQDLEEQKSMSHTIEQQLKILKTEEGELSGIGYGEDGDSENDQSLNLCCRHITGDD